MITIEEALEIVLKETKVLGFETVNILNSLNKVLAEDIYSKDNLPPFDKSAMDGYAIISDDTENASEEKPVKLKIKGTIKAGDFYKGQLKCGEALKIMTGAPVPNGADAVIQIENVEADNEEVAIFNPVEKNKNILNLGEEIKKGDIALLSGMTIRPSEIGLMASLGFSSAKVFKVPKMIVITTGDELIDVSEELISGKIRDCNGYSLMALGKNLQADVKFYGIVRDDMDVLFKKMQEAFEEGDIIITSGGVSAGDYDFVENCLKELGADIKFSSVAIKPGKPFTFAKYKDKLFFGLPGNPLAVINTFEQFVSPAAKKMMGKSDIHNKQFKVILGEDFKSVKGRTNYVYVNIEEKDGIYYAYKVGSQSSNQLLTISKANGIIILDKEMVKAGEEVNGRFIFK
ncbi:gephyrin-like molybdotransferase Glp [Clostridium aciditolerans]|uniref:Molybdopterin molybdenumtransferase n=1 Tax=Clostridium aciditolerans TaxID=339861 RepID=A0A934M025_9CLOT|nr:gephyrin-like molybdotransferase Glp [Clostridium aciditolerans]MBI6871649.1 molybdopterin molybdotransferase MoeA [Clostridium aciditolerans]